MPSSCGSPHHTIQQPSYTQKWHEGTYQHLPRSTPWTHRALPRRGAVPRNKAELCPTHLKECCNRAKRVPQHGGKVRHRLALLAQLQQCILPRLRAGQLVDPLVDLLTVHLSQRCRHRLGRRQENFGHEAKRFSQPQRQSKKRAWGSGWGGRDYSCIKKQWIWMIA